MGSVDLGEKKSSGGPSWKRPRVKIRIDMTPMVDIAFLLLIFFMVTTVFRLPQAMEMVLPANDPDNPPQPSKVFEKKLITFLVLENDSLAYQIGNDNPKALPWDSLRAKLLERREMFGDSVVVLAKLHKKATYASMVNLVDEFNVAKTTRFSIDHFTTYEDSLLRVSGFQTSGPADLPEPEYAKPSEGG